MDSQSNQSPVRNSTPQLPVVNPTPRTFDENPLPQPSVGNLPMLDGAMALVVLRALLGQIPIAPRPLPEFQGRDYEDPTTFLEQMEQYFQLQGTPDDQRVNLVAQALKGNAGKWWEVYYGLPFTWNRFPELFLQKYNGARVIGRLTSQLFSQKQGEKEPIGLFLQKKNLLCQRLQPLATEVNRVATLLQLLHPSIRRVIRSSQPAGFDTLLTRASEAEFDEAEIIQPPKKIERQVQVPGQSNPPRELPKCWYCPERHLNQDCPERDQGVPTKEKSPQENWRRGPSPGPAPLQ